MNSYKYPTHMKAAVLWECGKPLSIEENIEIPEANFSVEIPDEGDKYYFSESDYRKITWTTTIFSLLTISIFIETVTYQQDYLFWGIISLILGIIVFLIPILLPVKDDIETLKKRAQKERTKAWHKGKFDPSNEEK